MSRLEPGDLIFLERRRRLVRLWPVVGGLSLAILAIFGLWLYLARPLLANPSFVMEGLKKETIPASSLALMAGMLPVFVIICLVLTAMVLLFAFQAFSQEKKYLLLIQRLLKSEDP